jgi:hypothetical protein
MVLMYLSLILCALYALYQFNRTLLLTKFPDDPQPFTVNILWLQEKGAQIHKPRIYTHKEYGQRFHPLLHTSYLTGQILLLISSGILSVTTLT